MNLLDAIILGLVEGVTEFLPVSSTGHLIIVTALLGLDETAAQKEAVDTFNIMIQGGAILAVAAIFWPHVKQMLLGLFGRDRVGFKLWVNLTIAFLPAAVFGVLLNDLIREHLFYAAPVTAALFLGGVALLFLRKWQRRFYTVEIDEEQANGGHRIVDIEHLSWKQALVIGLFQAVAMWPGTSRSMMAIIGGMLVGMKPRQAAEFGFLLGIPTLGGACVYSGYKSFVVDNTNIFEVLGVFEVVVGALVAMLAAGVAVKWMLAYLNRHGMAFFGWYRIALSIMIFILITSQFLQIVPDNTLVEESRSVVTETP